MNYPPVVAVRLDVKITVSIKAGLETAMVIFQVGSCQIR
jgi:hypothetical protein